LRARRGLRGDRRQGRFEYLYDKPYDDNKLVRVAGPFMVESRSPHRLLDVDENDELINRNQQRTSEPGAERVRG
jgi:adenine-specific DNA-methyltransferase